MRKTARRKMMFGFAVTATAVLLSSAAFACTVFRGAMTVQTTGSNPGGHHNAATSVAHGNGQGMSHCSDPRMVGEGGTEPDVAGGDGIVPVGDNAAPVGEAITFELLITVAPSTVCTTVGVDQKLGAGNYAVTWANAFSTDCMAQVGGTGLPVGTLNVNGLGNGSGTFTIPAEATGVHPGSSVARYAGVCLTSTTQAGVLQGNRAPIRVV